LSGDERIAAFFKLCAAVNQFPTAKTQQELEKKHKNNFVITIKR
jgi:hypothetical protein